MPYRSPSPDDPDMVIFRSWFTFAFASAAAGIALLAHADSSFRGIVCAFAGASLVVAAWFMARHAWDNPSPHEPGEKPE